ncbi:hypothetical protein CMQ_4100 [Grosmannia clavigera kw1407]|uniref:Kynurenine formamidase n=1 Tax=Grosmannia clavigera (strain kw1407 / UAMH 11150) TaxID=655863 RepID=F0XA18_GROCL|nr:uncharacterized protein CMQ_4100 [Grosmannia clavigera kw1407]EFX06031.1 hypothetical protein CMQ_4100 [Grosmannia clavigera kw1407]
MAEKLQYAVHQYGSQHELQRLGVWEVDTKDTTKPWVVYIHGGAWRDPRILLETFVPTIDELSRQDKYAGAMRRVAGFVSLDYRLSPHPDLPQDPAVTSPRQFRNAQHPDHLDDVRQAMAFLQTRYSMGRRYVLVGHSAGACLALQLTASPGGVALPQAIIGVSGIYDLTGINERSGGSYGGFLTGAFGDASTWDPVAPRTCSADFAVALAGCSVLLARSQDDELVDEPEIDNMAERLRADYCSPSVWKDLRGPHDSCWEEGKELARLIARLLDGW